MTHTLTGTVHQLVSGEEGFEYENECNTPRSINGFRKKKKNHNNMACGHCWECGLHNRIFLTTAQDFQRDPSIIHPLEISHLSTRMQANPLPPHLLPPPCARALSIGVTRTVSKAPF